MIAAAAFCPHPPALVAEVAQGAAPELEGLREACREAIARLAAVGAPLAIVGAGPRDELFAVGSRGGFAGFGVDLETALGPDPVGAPLLPLSISVGAWLLRDALGAGASAIGVGARERVELPNGDWAVLIMGDGSARRSTAAPGYLDDRAEPYDRAIADALRAGDADGLVVSADGLLAAGAPVWEAIAPSLRREWDAELLYDDAPYGVGYFVAVWT